MINKSNLAAAAKNVAAKSTNMNALKIATILLTALTLTNQPSLAQMSDGDDQFEVIHQDIGRISGGASVAPQTTIVKQDAPLPARAFQAAALPAPQQQSASTFERHHQASSSLLSHNNRRQSGQQQQQATRKPNRITLAVRTAAPVQVSLAPFEQPAARQVVRAEQNFVSQLAPPPQSASFNLQPSFQPLSPTRQVASEHHTLVGGDSSPALASFRSSLAPHPTVNDQSSLHSALIAQVAAERAAAAAATVEPQPTDFPVSQPSLGSPIEALSSPSISQVQPPPMLHHSPSAAQVQPFFVNQPEEPIVAPSFEHVLGHGCPKKGVFSYENKDHCDRYYMCTNGTFTEEACPNGLAYSQMGAVYQHCAYNWNVDCGRKKTSEPLASPGCPWQFGIFPITQAGQCSIDYFVCEWGVPETKRCSPEGLFYDDRIKGCQWADQLGCKSEALLNFKCPPEDEDNPYWPYPRYYHNKQDIIVCVNEQPRLVHCNEDQVVEPSSLACRDLHKKKKKF